jgi:hypothetical protein
VDGPAESGDARCSTRSRRLRVVDYRPSEQVDLPLIPEGAAMFLFGARGSGAIDRVLAAIRRGRESALATRLFEDLLARPAMSPEGAREMLEAATVVAQIQYREGPDRVVAGGIFLPPGQPLGALIVSYDGGAYDPTKFWIVEHLRDNPSEGIDCVVFVRRPADSSSAESAASYLVDRDCAKLELRSAAVEANLLYAFAAGFVVGVAVYIVARTLHYTSNAPKRPSIDAARAASKLASRPRTLGGLMQLREELLRQC